MWQKMIVESSTTAVTCMGKLAGAESNPCDATGMIDPGMQDICRT
jgi:hypothetical protein